MELSATSSPEVVSVTFNCVFCSQKYTTENGFLIHLKTSTTKSPRLCNTCGCQFDNDCALNFHNLVKHQSSAEAQDENNENLPNNMNEEEAATAPTEETTTTVAKKMKRAEVLLSQKDIDDQMLDLVTARNLNQLDCPHCKRRFEENVDLRRHCHSHGEAFLRAFGRYQSEIKRKNAT